MPVCLAPSRMTVKMSPSVCPCFQSPSVRSDGVGFSIAPALPSPLPAVPWHDAHCESYNFLPVAIDEGDAATGFFVAFAAGFCCAAASIVYSSSDSAATADANHTVRDTTRIEQTSLVKRKRRLQYNPWVLSSRNAAVLARPAVVQTAKTFAMRRHNGVNRARFPQTFPQFLWRRTRPLRESDLNDHS